MTVNVPWSTLRPNPRDQRERAAAEFPGGGEAPPLDKDGEPEIAWDVTDFGKRMAFGGIVSDGHGDVPVLPLPLPQTLLCWQPDLLCHYYCYRT